MAVTKIRPVVVVATATAPLLPALLHALFHTPGLEITVLSRDTETSIPLPAGHEHSAPARRNSLVPASTSRIWHIGTSFAEPELASLLKGKETVICCLTGSDTQLSHSLLLVEAAQNAGVRRFLPSEYGLDTCNEKIRALLPAYQTRFELQGRLGWSGMQWSAVYAGLVVEEALKANGVLDMDVLWGSVAVFPHDAKVQVALSSYADVANAIVEVIMGDGEGEGKNHVYTAGFLRTMNEVIGVVEKELGREVERYEGNLEGAKKEAAERMMVGYFDGGVSLMERVATWDPEVEAWNAWRDGAVVERSGDWEAEIRRVVKEVSVGQTKGDGIES